MISVQNISKHYYSLVAVDDVSFNVSKGQVLGILGPNGAGKTTVLKMIAGFLEPDAGAIKPQGERWPAIGYKPERLLFPDRMRVGDYLQMVGRLCNMNRKQVTQAVSSALNEVNLGNARDKRIGECSKGMRQRLSLAQSIMGNPPLLLLDEPSNGLDPEGQADICNIIQRRHALGQTIVINSHQLPEVTRVCTHMIILKQGRIHYQGSVQEALALRPHVTIQVDKNLSALAELLRSLHSDVEVEENRVILNNEAIRIRRHVLSLLVGTGFDIVGVTQKRTTLEEIYAEAVQWHNAS
ncbi:MAG TPA: ABC transporter ATP-binding protein [Candidatus Sulfomarinibacteraceae bacterium]|nr:ABC transporter ATP-binding protein [Candidatus Sulfomarinibacteraceae bacterium]